MLGTGFPAARLLLVEQPFPWGPEGLRTSRFDRKVAQALEKRAGKEGIRVQAIRRPGVSPEESRRRWAIADTRDDARSLRWGEYTDDAELLELPLDGSLGEADEEPLYLVCTHGKHDPCCGQRGRPLVIALSAARPDRVWQASHLGGCRFAPTVLTLPLGLMYGRVPPSAASDLVVATDRGLVVGPFLRGRIGLAPAVQAALAFAHEQLALPACSDVSPLSMQSIDAARVGVRVTSRRGRFEVTVERRRMTAADLTCGAPGLSWFLAHRGVAIEPVDSN